LLNLRKQFNLVLALDQALFKGELGVSELAVREGHPAERLSVQPDLTFRCAGRATEDADDTAASLIGPSVESKHPGLLAERGIVVPQSLAAPGSLERSRGILVVSAGPEVDDETTHTKVSAIEVRSEIENGHRSRGPDETASGRSLCARRRKPVQ
jgi:hypothetical protein